MSMKKLLFFLLILLSFVLASCGGDPEPTNPVPNQQGNSGGSDEETKPNPTVPDEVYYTVEFLVEGRVVATFKVKEGESVIPPDINPSDYGVIFEGWDSDEYKCVTKDLKINAKVKSMEGEWFTVEFYAKGELVAFYRVEKGTSLTPPTINEDKYEEKFLGWDSNAYLCVEADLVINAVFGSDTDRPNPIEEFKVEFYVNGKLVYSTTASKGASVTPPVVSDKEYTFKGWDNDGYLNVESDLIINAIIESNMVNTYFNIDGVVINSNNPCTYLNINALDKINLADFGYIVPSGYHIVWDKENYEVNNGEAILYGTLEADQLNIYMYLDGNYYKDIMYSVDAPYTVSDLLNEVNSHLEEAISEDLLCYYVDNYETVVSNLNSYRSTTIMIYSYCFVEGEAVFYLFNEYVSGCNYAVTNLDSIVYPDEYTINDFLARYGYDNSENRYGVEWIIEEQHGSYIRFRGEIYENPSEFVIRFVYNDQVKEVIYDYNTPISEVKKQIRYYFTAEAGYSISWDFELEYSREVQIVEPIVTLREYEIVFYDNGYNELARYTFTIMDEIVIEYPEVPEVEGQIGRWPEVDLTIYDSQYIFPIYETEYSIMAVYQDCDSNGEIIFGEAEYIYFTFGEISELSLAEFKEKHNFAEKFNLESRDYFTLLDYESRFDEYYNRLKEDGYMGESHIIYYGYELTQYVIAFSTIEDDEEGNGSYGYTQYLSYNIYTDLDSLVIPTPGKCLYKDSSWSEFEFFADTYQYVEQIMTPTIYEITFDDGYNVLYYEYFVYEEGNNKHIKIYRDDYVLLDDWFYRGSDYTYHFEGPTNVSGYDGEWTQFELFADKVLNVSALYTIATYTLEFYVPYSVSSNNYYLHTSVNYNLENYENIVLPNVVNFDHYTTEWDLGELFEEKTQKVYLKATAITYTHDYYVNGIYVESYEYTCENYRGYSPYIYEEGYNIDSWYQNGNLVNLSNIGYGNHRLDAYKTVIEYSIQYLDLDNNIVVTIKFDVENPVTSHPIVPEIEGLDGRWVIYNGIDTFVVSEYESGTLGNYTLKVCYTTTGATPGLQYQPKNGNWNNYESLEVYGYNGEATNIIVVPSIYNNYKVTYLRNSDLFSEMDLEVLDIRSLEGYVNSFYNVETLMINSYLASNVNSFGNVKHLEIYPYTNVSEYGRKVSATPTQLETLKVYATDVLFDTNWFVGLTNLHYLELNTIANKEDGFNTLTQDITIKFIDEFSFLLYDNTVTFGENISVYIGDEPLDTLTEIVIPEAIKDLVDDKFVNTNIVKVSFEENHSSFYFTSRAFRNIEELDLSNLNGSGTISGYGLDSVKKITLPNNNNYEIDRSFVENNYEELHVYSLDSLLSYSVSPFDLAKSVSFYVDGQFYERKPYIILDQSYTKTDYNFSPFGFVIYENKNVGINDNQINIFLGTNYYFIDGIFYKVEDDHAVVMYIAEEYNAVILDSIDVDGKDYPVTTIGKLAIYKNNITNLYLGNNISRINDKGFCQGSVENIYAPNLAMYLDIKLDGDTRESSPTATGSNLYINNELFTTFDSPEGLTTIKSGLFYNCKSLKTVILNEGVKTIYTYAFAGTDLDAIYLPASLRFIDYINFGTVDKVYIADLVTYATTIEYGTLFGGTHVIDTPFDSGAKLYVNNQLVTELIFDETVTNINAFAFRGLHHVTKVVVENKNATIGRAAFSDMPDLVIYEGPEFSK